MIATVTLNPSLDKTLTVDGLVVDETNRFTSFRRDAGGKGINVSRVVHELGGKTIAYGFIGGIDGQIFKKLLQRKGVPVNFTPIKGETRTNIIVTDTRTRRQTRLDDAGPKISEGELLDLEKRISIFKTKPDYIVFAGSVPPGVPVDIYKRLIENSKKRGIKTVLDCDGKWFKAGIKALPDIIKPNVHEAEELLGIGLKTEKAIIEAIKTMLGMGIEIVVISRGKQGFIIGQGSRIYKVTPPFLEAVSSVGAGDSTIAGLVLKLSQGGSIEDAARLAGAAGAATVITPGTELCHKETVERLLPLIEIKKVR
jgi:6-phosphofructokinase 2